VHEEDAVDPVDEVTQVVLQGEQVSPQGEQKVEFEPDWNVFNGQTEQTFEAER